MKCIVKVGKDLSSFEEVKVDNVYRIEVHHGVLFLLNSRLEPARIFSKGNWLDVATQ
jgi:hypothetical protein